MYDACYDLSLRKRREGGAYRPNHTQQPHKSNKLNLRITHIALQRGGREVAGPSASCRKFVKKRSLADGKRRDVETMPSWSPPSALLARRVARLLRTPYL